MTTQGNKPGRQGKKRQTFRQRDIERAARAAPDRTIIIRLDGTLELIPGGESIASDQKNPLDRVLRDASHKDRTA